MDDLYERIYEAVKLIPKGKVSTYGDVAAMVGNRKLARVVGNALHVNPYEGIVPCHRVVNAQGKLAKNFGFGGVLDQKRRLVEEDVEVINFKVDLDEYRWIAGEDSNG